MYAAVRHSRRRSSIPRALYWKHGIAARTGKGLACSAKAGPKPISSEIPRSHVRRQSRLPAIAARGWKPASEPKSRSRFAYRGSREERPRHGLCGAHRSRSGGVALERSRDIGRWLFGRTVPPEPLRGSGGLGGRVGSGGAYLNAVGVTGASVVTQFCLPSDSNARSPATPI